MTPPMHSPDDIQNALEMTKVLREPDRRIDTYGETRFEMILRSHEINAFDFKRRGML